MNHLTPIEHKNQRVLTTQQLAEGYGTEPIKIRQNFTNNKGHYVLGKHYFMLEGEELKAFKNRVENFDSVKSNRMALWTEKGALLHAKSLNTDKAWEVYDHLVETYFRARDMFQVPKTLPEALRFAAELAEQIEQDKPKVLFAETCLASQDSILVRELAKIINNQGIPTGEHKLYAWMREKGLLMRGNEPYQRYIQSGYFVVEQKPFDTPYGTKMTRTTRVTPRGQAYIIKRLTEEAV